MNYRNLSMEELTGVLINEPDRNRFIDASKIFIENFANGEYVSKEDHEAAIEEARDENFQKGYDEGFKEGKED